MKIPKFFHPILGVMAGTILFLAGIALLSTVFVATFKAVQYAKPFIMEISNNLYNHLTQWLPL